jgi:hypothetical protein
MATAKIIPPHPPTPTHHALPNNIAVWNSSIYWENTCRVLAPNRIYPHGKILLHPGQPPDLSYLQSVISRPIYDASGNVDLDVSSSSKQDLPNPGYLGGHTDNQIVKQNDGSLLVMRACMYWAPVINPTPWQQNTLTDYRGSSVPRVGGRGANVVWHGFHPGKPRPLPPGEIDWVLQGAADPFVFNNGGADGFGGSDRPEFYACPYTGYVYLTAGYVPAEGAPGYDSTKTEEEQDKLIVLLYSPNQGKDWDVLTKFTGAASQDLPLVMTSTPNGRLFLYHWYYSTGELFCSNIFDAAAGEKPKISAIYGYVDQTVGDSQNGYRMVFNDSIVSYSETINGKHLNQPPPDPDMATKMVNRISDPSISRVSTDKTTSRVRVSLRTLNENKRNVYVILDIGVQDGNDGVPHLEPSSLKRTGRIEAKDKTTHSVLRGTFIDPDYVGTPPDFASNTSLFYWLEWPGVGYSDMSARYCFFSGSPSHQSGISALSVKDGALRTWSSSDPGGDYLSGGFFFWKGPNYLAQWREPDGIRANIVGVQSPLQPPIP